MISRILTLFVALLSITVSPAQGFFDTLVEPTEAQTTDLSVSSQPRQDLRAPSGRSFTNLNVRALPQAQARVIAQINSDSGFALIDGSNMLLVQFNNQVGYVATSCLGSNQASVRDGVTNLLLREGPGPRDRVLRRLNGGATLQVLGESGDRLQVRVGDQTGYVSAQYVERGNRTASSGCELLPEPNQPALTRIPGNTSLSPLTSTGFTHIRLADGRRGFVSSDYVSGSGQTNPVDTGLTQELLRIASQSDLSCSVMPSLKTTLEELRSQSMQCTATNLALEGAAFLADMLEGIRQRASGNQSGGLRNSYLDLLFTIDSGWALAMLREQSGGFGPRDFEALVFDRSLPGLVKAEGAPPIKSSRALFVGNLLDRRGEMPEGVETHQRMYFQMLACEPVALGLEQIGKWLSTSITLPCLRESAQTFTGIAQALTTDANAQPELKRALEATGLGIGFLSLGAAQRAQALARLSPVEQVRVMHAVSQAAKSVAQSGPDAEPAQSSYTEAEKEELRRKSPMAIIADKGLLNQLGKQTLTGYLTEGNPPDNFVKDFVLESLSDGALFVKLTMVNTRVEFDEETREETRRNEESIYRLGIRPDVVKGVADTFEFALQKFSIQIGTGAERDALNDANQLLQALSAALNSAKYRDQIEFRYLPSRKVFRVRNALAMFPSFPRFKIQLVEVRDGKVGFFGDPDAAGLARLIAGSLELDQRGNVKTSAAMASMSRPVAVQRSASAPVSSAPVSSNPVQGQASVRIEDKVLNDFAASFRQKIVQDATASGWKDLNQKAAAGQDLKAGDPKEFVRNLMRGFESVRVEFSDQRVILTARGDLRLISWQSRKGLEIFNSYVTDVSNFVGRGVADASNAVARGAIHSWNWLTRQVGIDLQGDPERYRTNPQDYLPISGEFELRMDGTVTHISESDAIKVALRFDKNTVKDTKHPGTLEKWLGRLMGTVEFFINPFGLSDKIYTAILHAVDYTSGSETKKRDSMLEYFIDIALRSMVTFAGEQFIPGIQFQSNGYDDFRIRFVEFSVAEGSQSKLDEARLSTGNVHLEASTR